MVVIRLARRGSRGNTFYQIVVTDRRHPRDGRFIERVGYYNPIAQGRNVLLQVEKERIFYWLNQGAQATVRVRHLIKKLEESAEEAKKDSLRKSEHQSKKVQAKMAEEANTEKDKAEPYVSK